MTIHTVHKPRIREAIPAALSTDATYVNHIMIFRPIQSLLGYKARALSSMSLSCLKANLTLTWCALILTNEDWRPS